MTASGMRLAIGFALLACVSACGFYELDGGDFHHAASAHAPGPTIINTEDERQLGQLAAALEDKRVMFVGEVHDRLEHHRNQLRIIQALYARYPDLAIGVEYFQQPFQPALDDYIAGRIDEREMLVRTEYFKRWQLDYRLLQPIFQFARDNHIPVRALKVSDEIHSKVFKEGMKSLTPEERAQVPADIQPASEPYRDRLQSIFGSHPTGSDFANFEDGVLLWDESMADTAARYLQAHPRSRMVVLAGMVHVMFGEGIPERVDRRLGGSQSVVAINGNDFGDMPGIADFQLTTREGVTLPKAGKLGVSILDGTNGVRINDFTRGSAAKSVGMSAGDLIVAVDGVKVSSILDLKSVMYDRRPGERIQLSVLRDDSTDRQRELQFNVVLR